MNTTNKILLLLLPLIAFIIVHVFALAGIFISIAYLIIYFTTSNYPPCLICNKVGEDEYCEICRTNASKSKSPRNLRSAFYNFLILICISSLSLLIVYGEHLILQKLGFTATRKTAYFDTPARQQYKLGEIFPLKIEIKGIETSVNAIQADLSFDPNEINVVEITTHNSFAEVFLQKEIDNEKGFARITGGLPNPGYNSEEGLFATVLLTGLLPGLTQVEFLPTSMVMANDGKGTNTLKEFAKAAYLILPERVSTIEQNLQETVFSSPVLGSQTSETPKLILYDEEPKVLGDNTPDNEGPSVFENLYSKILNPVVKIFVSVVEFTVNFWTKIFDF